MIDFTFETDIDDVEVIKPNIPGNFISAKAPDVFLFIKGRLIRRKIFHMNLGMTPQKKPNFFSFMPFCSIHIEIDDMTAKLFQHMLQHSQKSLLITLGSAYQAFSPQQRCHPPRQIEPLAMLTSGRNFESLTFLSPASSQTWMQAKASLILKNNGFVVFKVEQFFLTPGENDGHPWHVPEDKYSRLFSDCNPDSVTNIVPVALLTLSQTPSSGEPLEWVHPSPP
jgi:hypothetical protein